MNGELAGRVDVAFGSLLQVAEVGDGAEVFVLAIECISIGSGTKGNQVDSEEASAEATELLHTFRSITSRLFASSSFFNGSSSFVSAAVESPGGGALSSDLFSVSVDCHRWKSGGDADLKLDGWRGRLDGSTLVLRHGVDNDLENVEDVKVRLCLMVTLRSMIQYRGDEGVDVEGKTFKLELVDGCISDSKISDHLHLHFRGVMDLGAWRLAGAK